MNFDSNNFSFLWVLLTCLHPLSWSCFPWKQSCKVLPRVGDPVLSEEGGVQFTNVLLLAGSWLEGVGIDQTVQVVLQVRADSISKTRQSRHGHIAETTTSKQKHLVKPCPCCFSHIRGQIAVKLSGAHLLRGRCEKAHNVIIDRVGNVHEVLCGDGGERQALYWEHSLDDLSLVHAGRDIQAAVCREIGICPAHTHPVARLGGNRQMSRHIS